MILLIYPFWNNKNKRWLNKTRRKMVYCPFGSSFLFISFSHFFRFIIFLIFLSFVLGEFTITFHSISLISFDLSLFSSYDFSFTFPLHSNIRIFKLINIWQKIIIQYFGNPLFGSFGRFNYSIFGMNSCSV